MRILVLVTIVLVPLRCWSLSEIDEGMLSDVSTPSSLVLAAPEAARADSRPVAQDKTTASSAVIDPRQDGDDPITEKDVSSIVVGEEKAAALPSATSVRFRSYSIEHPDGTRDTSSDSYMYIIRAGDVEMRDTFIQQRSSDIRPGSWVDIKTR